MAEQNFKDSTLKKLFQSYFTDLSLSRSTSRFKWACADFGHDGVTTENLARYERRLLTHGNMLSKAMCIDESLCNDLDVTCLFFLYCARQCGYPRAMASYQSYDVDGYDVVEVSVYTGARIVRKVKKNGTLGLINSALTVLLGVMLELDKIYICPLSNLDCNEEQKENEPILRIRDMDVRCCVRGGHDEKQCSVRAQDCYLGYFLEQPRPDDYALNGLTLTSGELIVLRILLGRSSLSPYQVVDLIVDHYDQHYSESQVLIALCGLSKKKIVECVKDDYLGVWDITPHLRLALQQIRDDKAAFRVLRHNQDCTLDCEKFLMCHDVYLSDTFVYQYLAFYLSSLDLSEIDKPCDVDDIFYGCDNDIVCIDRCDCCPGAIKDLPSVIAAFAYLTGICPKASQIRQVFASAYTQYDVNFVLTLLKCVGKVRLKVGDDVQCQCFKLMTEYVRVTASYDQSLILVDMFGLCNYVLRGKRKGKRKIKDYKLRDDTPFTLSPINVDIVYKDTDEGYELIQQSIYEYVLKHVERAFTAYIYLSSSEGLLCLYPYTLKKVDFTREVKCDNQPFVADFSPGLMEVFSESLQPTSRDDNNLPVLDDGD